MALSHEDVLRAFMARRGAFGAFVGDIDGGDEPTIFVSDTFTDADGVLLSAHTGEMGATWTLRSGTGAPTIQTDRIFCATATAVFTASGVPPSPDYYVEAIADVVTDANDNMGICGRMAEDGSANYYLWRYVQSSDGWGLFRFVGGTPTQIGSTFADNWSTGSRTFRLDMQGSTIRGLTEGIERVSVTDTTFADAGRAGIRWGALQTSTTCRHMTSFIAVG